MHVIILLGPPGSGKGTAAEGLKSLKKCAHVSTGDILRESAARSAEVGLKAKEYMDRGELVPDDIMVKIVARRLEEEPADAWVLLDGFPRTLNQAKLLDKSLAERKAKVERVFLLEAPRQLLVERLSRRLVCGKCGAVYHQINIPPKREGICDNCGGKLYQRLDDQEATVVNRLRVYQAQTEELAKHYEKQGVLARIDARERRKALEKISEALAITRP